MPVSKLSAGVVVPPDVDGDGAVHLLAYQRAVGETDHLPPADLRTPVFGLVGEVGSLLSVVKKKRRDAAAYAGYDADILEELGDVIWYFTCLANRATLDLSVLAQRALRDTSEWDEVQRDEFGTWGDVQSNRQTAEDHDLSSAMGLLAELTGELAGGLRTGMIEANRDWLSGKLVTILRALIATAEAVGIDLDAAARGNLEKIYSRYPREILYPLLSDIDLPSHERLPRQFELLMREHEVNGKTYVLQTCNGVIIGDRLTDNKAAQDDYRFHDVFHVAYAVHLGWSPILRGLFHVKRKSKPGLDENEDGARAGLIEEGIATFIFERAIQRNLFEGLERLDFDLLKLVQGFVRGFEVERCAFWQWERAILDGFRIFREFKKHRRGYVVADLEAHTIQFRAVDTTLGALASITTAGSAE
jgi:NTP pyrophosphatase (non-canonical NTP hydrolase)